jgi:hypothetical protein
MKFLNSWSIDLTKVPTYTLFKKKFTEDVDIHLARIILEDDDVRLTTEIKNEFKKIVNVIDPKTNLLSSLYNSRFGYGRRYPECPSKKLVNNKPDPNYNKIYSALISQPRLIKNTIFKYHKYIDIDQKKGHPTIIKCIANKAKMCLETYDEYLSNFDSYVNEMSEYYSVEGEQPITKKDIKLLFNRTIYGGGHKNWVEDITTGKRDIHDEDSYKIVPKQMKNKKNPHEFYLKFYEETQQIINLVYASNTALAEQVCKEESLSLWQKKSRTMSYFCGIIENEITYQAYKFLQTNGHIYDRHLDWGLDGLTMMPFAETDEELQEIMNDLNKYVRTMTGFSGVEFLVKPFDDSEILHNSIFERESMIIDEDNQDIETEEDKPDIVTFNDIANEFEKNHCKIVNKSVFVKQAGDNNIMMSKTQITTSYEHLSYQKIKEKNGEQIVTTHSFIKDWMMSNDKQRKYEDMGVYPNESLMPSDYYNIWTPFKMQRVEEYIPKPEALQLILNHIKILCDNDDDVFIYVCKWIGQMLAFPEIKPGVCITLISKEGAGKNALIKFLSNMMGSKKVFETTQPSRDVWGDFNSLMMNAYLVNLSELSKKETIQSSGKIKGLITDSALFINEKGLSQVEMVSYHRFLITTNNEDPIKSLRDDRRNLIIRSSDELIKNKLYFADLYKQIEDVNVLKTCYEYFIHLDDLNNFTSLIPPVVEYQNDIQDNTMCPIERWLIEYVTEQYDDNKIELLGRTAINIFMQWLSRNNIKYEINGPSFALRLKRMNLKGLEKGRKTNRGNTTIFNIPVLKQELNIDNVEILKVGELEEEIFYTQKKTIIDYLYDED